MVRTGIRAWAAGAAAALTLAATCAPAFAASYTVQQGDTYWSLAQQFGTSVGALEAANPTAPAWDLYPGLQLQIPDTQSGPEASASDDGNTQGLSQSAINLVAQLAVAEEGDQSFEDQVGVAAVVLNRMNSGQFPKTAAGVIFEPGQFTSVSNGYFYNVGPDATAVRAVRQALNGDDPTNGALYFFDPGPDVSDPWVYSRPVTAVIDGTVYTR